MTPYLVVCRGASDAPYSACIWGRPQLVHLLADLHTGAQAAVKPAESKGDWFDFVGVSGRAVLLPQCVVQHLLCLCSLASSVLRVVVCRLHIMLVVGCCHSMRALAGQSATCDNARYTLYVEDLVCVRWDSLSWG